MSRNRKNFALYPAFESRRSRLCNRTGKPEQALGNVRNTCQSDGDDLSHCVKKCRTKSALNLRGEHPTSSWHRVDMTVATNRNVIHYNLSLGSGRSLTLEQMDELGSLRRQVPKPISIHCDGGAERSGLISALYCFAFTGDPAEKADRQLTIWYGHVPLIRPKVVARENSF